MEEKLFEQIPTHKWIGCKMPYVIKQVPTNPLRAKIGSPISEKNRSFSARLAEGSKANER